MRASGGRGRFAAWAVVEGLMHEAVTVEAVRHVAARAAVPLSLSICIWFETSVTSSALCLANCFKLRQGKEVMIGAGEVGRRHQRQTTHCTVHWESTPPRETSWALIRHLVTFLVTAHSSEGGDDAGGAIVEFSPCAEACFRCLLRGKAHPDQVRLYVFTSCKKGHACVGVCALYIYIYI